MFGYEDNCKQGPSSVTIHFRFVRNVQSHNIRIQSFFLTYIQMNRGRNSTTMVPTFEKAKKVSVNTTSCIWCRTLSHVMSTSKWDWASFCWNDQYFSHNSYLLGVYYVTCTILPWSFCEVQYFWQNLFQILWKSVE